MRIQTIHIITIMGITHMATFRSIMISMTLIISIIVVALIVTSAAVILAVILTVVTAVVFMAGEGGPNRRTEAGAFAPVFFHAFMQKAGCR